MKYTIDKVKGTRKVLNSLTKVITLEPKLLYKIKQTFADGSWIYVTEMYDLIEARRLISDLERFNKKLEVVKEKTIQVKLKRIK